MRQKLLLPLLLLLGTHCSKAEMVGVIPVVGESYWLYNIGQAQYLTAYPDGTFDLSGDGTEFSLAECSGGNITYQLVSDYGLLATSFGSPALYPAPGMYNEWRFRLVDAELCAFAVACLEDETKAFSYIYYSSATATIAKTSAMTMFADGEWLFVGADIPESVISVETERDAASRSERVYNIAGQTIANSSDTIERLGQGIYITNGKKIVIR